MATQTFAPILGRRMRVTQLDECGAIIPTSKKIVTDGFITVSLSPQVEEGNEIIIRNAGGRICINEKSADSFKRFDLEIEFCDVNPSLLSMTTNAEEYENAAADVVGITVPEGEMTGKFALEIWTGLAGQACGDSGETASGYLLLPLVQSGTLGDLEITGEDKITFSLANSFTRGGNTWGDGPYDVMRDDADTPGPLTTPLDAYDHLLLLLTDVAPPPEAEQPTLVTAP